jgi:hypothetical protein
MFLQPRGSETFFCRELIPLRREELPIKALPPRKSGNRIFKAFVRAGWEQVWRCNCGVIPGAVIQLFQFWEKSLQILFFSPMKKGAMSSFVRVFRSGFSVL